MRGTSRSGDGVSRIESAGLEGAESDPDRVGTVLEEVADVAVVIWALGAATGPSAVDVNGDRLESMLERLVDTPVRGFVLDAPPAEGEDPFARAVELTTLASDTWRIPVEVVRVSRSARETWVAEMARAVRSVLG